MLSIRYSLLLRSIYIFLSDIPCFSSLQTILGTAIPKITDQFNRLDDIAWYGAAYFTCFGGFQPLWGKSYKYFPLKPVFVDAVAIFEAGSLLCGAAPNSPALIAGRAIAGVGGAGVACGASTIVGLCTPKEKRPIFLGIIGVTYAFAAVVGPLLGGAFSDRVSWRWCFYVNVPIGGVVALVILGILRLPALVKPIEAPLVSKLGQLDFVGVGLTMAAMVCFILALQYGGVTHPWSSSVVIGLLVGFAAIVVTLVLWEMHRGERAMLVPRLLSNRTLWAGAGFQFFFAGSYFLLLFFLPLYFQSVKAASPVRSGVLTLPFVVTAGLFIVGGGITVAKTGHAIPFTTAGAAIATVGFGLLYTLETGTPAAKWIGYQILLGAGIAFPFQNCLSTVQATVATADIASATSIMLCMYSSYLPESQLTCSASLSDPRWSFQYGHRDCGVLQQAHRRSAHISTHHRPQTSHSHRCNRTESGLSTGGDCRNSDGLHGGHQVCVCGGDWHGRHSTRVQLDQPVEKDPHQSKG